LLLSEAIDHQDAAPPGEGSLVPAVAQLGRPLGPTSAATGPLLDAQSRDWQRGERRPVENYLADQPALANDAAAVLDLICHEVLLRRRQGKTPASTSTYGASSR
jgi:hypothetical protein